MKQIFLAGAFLVATQISFAQNIDKLINPTEVERIERTLASDDMQGRKPFTPSIDKAADFIAAEFKKSGLKYFTGLNSYRQPFSMKKATQVSAGGSLDNVALNPDNIITVTTDSLIDITEKSGYIKLVLDTGLNLMQVANQAIEKNQPAVIFVGSSYAKVFPRLKRFKGQTFDSKSPVIFVLTDNNPATFSFTIKHTISISSLANVIGVLPGRTKPEETVIFSAHYDHLGIGKANAAGDSIYNGANDDAAGTTAVIMLANYFSKLKNNERTLIFVAFTAEELGGFGSQYFSGQIDADKAVAMFNIEMIGTESEWGKNSAYITGFDKSDFGKILQNNLAGSNFKFEPDPYTKQQLFYRSDNASLAVLGVPAHTISTSKMDTEKFYHTQEDEVETLDMNNMAEIIKAIIISSKGIISGKETPSRVEKMK
jgi:hypothetical protein